MIEQGIEFTFQGEDGTIASVNDPTDANFVGYLTELPSGMDSPDLRLDGAVVTEGHGYLHGQGYAGRKAPGFVGFIYAQTPTVWNPLIRKLAKAVWAVQADGVLRWTPTGETIERALWYRTNEANPLRITDRIPKRFQFGLSVEDWRVLGYTMVTNVETSGTSPAQVVNNQGDVPGPLSFRITGPVTNPVVTRSSDGKRFTLTSVLGAGVYRDVYFWPPDPGVLVTGAAGNFDGELNVGATDMDLQANVGSQTFTLTGTGTTVATKLGASYRHAWRL